MGRFAAVAFDLPGHGRSDGLIAHIPCWFEFIDAAREVVVEHLPNVCFKRYPGTKMFGLGESIGGGVLFSLLHASASYLTVQSSSVRCSSSLGTCFHLGLS